ncbi:MAG: V-type ATP synthase subunit B, partial [bacterium]|nr:V-type ATP synthase subunit B [bacterium]
ASYARGKEAEELAMVLGEAALTDSDIAHLKFSRKFEEEFINQSLDENRDIEKTLDLGWKLIKMLPKSEIKRIPPHIMEKYWRE